jgi:hypothetical protein
MDKIYSLQAVLEDDEYLPEGEFLPEGPTLKIKGSDFGYSGRNSRAVASKGERKKGPIKIAD